MTDGSDKALYKPKKDGSATLPVLNTATPMISNKELMKKAIVSWMLESHFEKHNVRAMSY